MDLKFRHTTVASGNITLVFVCALALLLIFQTLILALSVHAESSSVETSTTLVAPNVIKPDNNTIRNGLPLTYAWQPVEGADHYIYESYDNDEMTALHKQQSVNTENFERFEQHGAELWWRVRAVSSLGESGPWSQKSRVIIDNVAPTVQNVTEGDISKVSGVMAFKFEVNDEYPDKVIAAMDDAHMQASQIREAVADRSVTTKMQRVVVRITLNIDTLELTNGPHTLTVHAVDYASNKSDPLQVNFNVANTPPPATEDPIKPEPTQPVEAIQTIPLPEAAPIAPILGSEQIIATDTVLPDSSAVTHAETKTVKDTIPIDTHSHPVEKPHVNFSWPVWLSFGALLSGTGWWVFSGRKRL